MIEYRCSGTGALLRFALMFPRLSIGKGDTPDSHPSVDPRWNELWQQQQANPQPVTVELDDRIKLYGCCLVPLCWGLSIWAIVWLFTGGTDSERVGVVVASILAGVFLLLGGYTWWKAATAKSGQITIDQTGIRMNASKGSDWQVGWAELAAVAMPLAIKLNRERRTSPFYRPRRVRKPTLLVRLEFIPNQHERFAADHPALQEYLGRQNEYGAYRLPLGPDQEDNGASVSAALGVFAQGRYHGVIDEGVLTGFS